MRVVSTVLPRLAVLLAAVVVPMAVGAPGLAVAAVPEGAEWTQAWIDEADGTQLHVDVLRPKGLPADAKTPVIAIVSPYLGHAKAGESVAGDPTATPGPSPRFNDLIEGAKLFERGYTVILVDLRGSGGSSGCLDILGPGEQADITAAVEWAAAQPWSTGRVGMYGKSYDGNTGMAGAALRPKGLEAVVAQQVTPDRYRSSYSGGVRYLQSLAYPSVSYGSGAELGFTVTDDPGYTLNSAANSADCQAGLAGHYSGDPTTDFWTSRNLVAKGRGSTVPLLMTHGFLDTNTNIGGGAIEAWNGMAGDRRMWLGWWDHVRGNDLVDDRLAMGRSGWFDEVVRFYDHHLKRLPQSSAPTGADPRVAIQTGDGTWRNETSWPPADADRFALPIAAGSYADDGDNVGSQDAGAGAGGLGASSGVGGRGTWTTTPPLPHPAHLAGIPRLTVDLGVTLPATNLVANVYDVAPDGMATMVSRGARLVDAAGPAELQLYPSDWRFAPGHRIGLLLSGANAEAWIHTPTLGAVEVRGGTLELPLLRYTRTVDLPGASAPRLEEYAKAAPFAVAAETLAAAERREAVPPAQTARPASAAPAPVPAVAPKPTGRLTVRLALRRRRGGDGRKRLVTITGTAPRGSLVKLTVLRGRKVIARRTRTAPQGRYTARVMTGGTTRGLRVRATTRLGTTVLRAQAAPRKRAR